MDENKMVMPVQPMYGGGYGNGGGNGGFGFGGDWAWILLLLLLGGNNWGMGGFGGGMMWPMMMGGMLGGGGIGGIDYLYPWLNNSEHISGGFRDAQLSDSVTSVRDGISSLSTQLCNCCGDMQLGMANGFSGVNQNVSNAAAGIQQSLCNGFNSVNQGMASGFAGTNATITGAQNALTQQLFNNEIANLNRSFAEQTANTAGFTSVNSGISDLRYSQASEACATRTASAQNTRDIIDAQNRGTQAILDKLCQLELDGVKGQLAQAQRENIGLQNAVNMATMQASQTAQTAQILAGQAAEIDGVYNRLKNCPVPSMPVYGNVPIFNCNGYNQNNGCGCGCGG